MPSHLHFLIITASNQKIEAVMFWKQSCKLSVFAIC